MRLLNRSSFVVITFVTLGVLASAQTCGPPAHANKSNRATPTPTITLRSVDAVQLAKARIILTPPPPGSVPAVTQAAAEQAALRPGDKVREIVLAMFDNAGSVPPIHALAWVISIRPAGGFGTTEGGSALPRSPEPPIRLKWELRFVDATSGKLLFDISGSQTGRGPS